MLTLAQRLGLVKEIDLNLQLLKVHLPYHESDHVLNFAFNILAGGLRLEDMEQRRSDEHYMNGLGANAFLIPPPPGTSLVDLSRPTFLPFRMLQSDTRESVGPATDWIPDRSLRGRGRNHRRDLGGLQRGMDMSYKGIWAITPGSEFGQHQRSALSGHRPGNAVSHLDSVPWMDRAVALVKPYAGSVTVRGDTDFTHTEHLDRWDAEGTLFILGMDAHAKVVNLADHCRHSLEAAERLPKYEITTQERSRPENVKERIVKEREFKNVVLVGESVAELDYNPSRQNAVIGWWWCARI